MMNTDYMFAKVVGQEKAKSKIAHYHTNRFQRNRTFPNTLLTGAKGNGKTELAMAIGRGLYQVDTDGKPCLKSDGKTPLPRTFREINASTIKSTTQFINSVLIPHVVDKEVTLFIDEASEIPPKVEMAMLTMLNPNESNKTQFVDIETDSVIDLDFTKCCFIFATTDAQALSDPLVNRLERIDIEEYTNAQLAEIIQRVAKEVKFEDDVLNDVASTVRCNARQAVKRAKDVQDLVTKKGAFGVKQWNELRKSLAILPLGLSPLEVSIMRVLHEHPDGITLTGIAARTGLSSGSIQRDYETYLMKQNLIQITAGKGRTLTPHGTQYLRDFEKESLTK